MLYSRWNVCAVAQTWNTAVVWPPREMTAFRDRKMGIVQDGAGRVDDRQTREILRRGQRLFARFEGRKRQPRRLTPPPLNFRNFCNALCSSNASIMSPLLLSETSDFACGGSFLFELVLGIINYYQLFWRILTSINTSPVLLTFQRLLYISLQSRICPPILKKFFIFCGGHSAKLRIAFKTSFVHHISQKYFLFRVDIFCTRVYPF